MQILKDDNTALLNEPVSSFKLHELYAMGLSFTPDQYKSFNILADTDIEPVSKFVQFINDTK